MGIPENQIPQTQIEHQPGKADVGKRIIAALIDGILAGVVSLVPFVGGIAAGVYILIRDGLELEFMDRRSIGKKFMKLRPVRSDGLPMDLGASVKRNIVFVIGPVAGIFVFIPVLGLLIVPLLGIVALIITVIEVVLVLTDVEGRRLGDKIANTKVIEVAE